ncbi:hypothetical protein Peur_037722 [Populus x canadensis]
MEELLGLVQLRGQDKDEGDDRLALAGRCLLPPGFLSVSPLFPDLSLSSPSSSVPGICCSQRKTAELIGTKEHGAENVVFITATCCSGPSGDPEEPESNEDLITLWDCSSPGFSSLIIKSSPRTSLRWIQGRSWGEA